MKRDFWLLTLIGSETRVLTPEFRNLRMSTDLARECEHIPERISAHLDMTAPCWWVQKQDFVNRSVQRLGLSPFTLPQNETWNIHACHCWHFQIFIPWDSHDIFTTLYPLATSLCCNVLPSPSWPLLLLLQASAKGTRNDVDTRYQTHTVSPCLCVCVSVYTCWCKDNGFQTKSWHCNTGLVLRFADWGQVSWDRSLLSAWISWGPPVTVGTQAAWFGHVLMLFDLEVWKFQEVFVSSYLFLSILAVHVISYTFIYYIYLYHIYILYIIYIIYMYIMVRCIEVPLFSLHFRFGRLTCQSM
jgi:hypothetical protein